MNDNLKKVQTHGFPKIFGLRSGFTINSIKQFAKVVGDLIYRTPIFKNYILVLTGAKEGIEMIQGKRRELRLVNLFFRSRLYSHQMQISVSLKGS